MRSSGPAKKDVCVACRQKLVFPFLGITLAMILLALVMSFTLLLNSSKKRKRDRGVDDEQRERKLFDKSCSTTSSFLDALGRSFQIPGLTLGTVDKLQFSGEQYFSANALNLLSMGFLEKASLIFWPLHHLRAKTFIIFDEWILKYTNPLLSRPFIFIYGGLLCLFLF